MLYIVLYVVKGMLFLIRIKSHHNFIFFLFFASFAVLAQENFKCPDDYGFYPHHSSCDKYWKCDNGASELKTCGNGLAFDATDPKYLSENCKYTSLM